MHRIASSCACAVSSVQAADPGWKPQKNVEIVVGAQAAGANDRAGRLLQKILTETGAVPGSMTVVNKPGQGQSLAVAYVNAHPADPHYLLILGSSWVTTAITTGSVEHAPRSLADHEADERRPRGVRARRIADSHGAGTWSTASGKTRLR